MSAVGDARKRLADLAAVAAGTDAQAAGLPVGRSEAEGHSPAEEFAVVIAALLAGRIDGQQAITSCAAIHDRLATPDAHDTETLAEVLAPFRSLLSQSAGCFGGYRNVSAYDLDAAIGKAERILAARIVQARAGEGALRERIEAEHREEWASYIDNWDAAVGPEPPTVRSIVAALRLPRPPFGVSARETAGDRDA